MFWWDGRIAVVVAVALVLLGVDGDKGNALCKLFGKQQHSGINWLPRSAGWRPVAWQSSANAPLLTVLR